MHPLGNDIAESLRLGTLRGDDMAGLLAESRLKLRVSEEIYRNNRQILRNITAAGIAGRAGAERARRGRGGARAGSTEVRSGRDVASHNSGGPVDEEQEQMLPGGSGGVVVSNEEEDRSHEDVIEGNQGESRNSGTAGADNTEV